MTQEQPPFEDPSSSDTHSRVWHRILTASMAIPGAKVNRTTFLRSQLQNYCTEQQVQNAIDTRPAQAGLSLDLMDKLADSCIRGHVLKASGTSFAAGLPGGLAMAGTIPADVTQFHWHVVVLSQKLAYLYGWPDILEEGEVDEQTEQQLTLLIGAMMGARVASRVLAEIAQRFAAQVAHRLPRQALTKYAIYNVTKQTAKWVGIQVTKSTASRGISKVIPVVGGVLSAGVTAAMMRPMAHRLKDHLRALRYALPDESE